MASRAFLQGVRSVVKGDVDFDTVTLKGMLMATAPSVANLDAWANRSDVTGEFSDTGYTAGGFDQAFTLDAADTTNHRQTITLTDNTTAYTSVTWPTPPVGVLIYVNSGTDTTDTLLYWVLFSATTAPSAGAFPIEYSGPVILAV